MMKEVSEVGGGEVVEGLVSDEEDFKLDSLLDEEPMEVLEDWRYVVSGAVVGEEMGRILDVL